MTYYIHIIHPSIRFLNRLFNSVSSQAEAYPSCHRVKEGEALDRSVFTSLIGDYVSEF